MIKKYIIPVKIRIREALDYFNYLFYSSQIPDHKFIIFATARTGSTLLTDLLNSHPLINCDSEILLKFVKNINQSPLFPETYIKSQAIKSLSPFYGCNLKYYQLNKISLPLNICPENIIVNLYKSGWKIIYLKRENILKSSLSNLIAEKRGQWNHTSDKPFKKIKFFIDYEKLLKSIKYHQIVMLEEKIIMEKIPHLPLIYEQDLLHSQQHQITGDKVYQYLSLKSHPVKSQYKKVSSNNLADDIENYQEIISKLQQSEYAKFIDF